MRFAVWLAAAALVALAESAAAAPRTALVEQFTDAYFAREMKAMNVPGAAIVVVENGAVVLEKGYGVAEVSSRRLVDPETTAFRTASVGKVFTAMSVLELARQGKLRLDQPVAAYTPELPGLTSQVTLRRLLLHTAGFDERLIGYQSRSAADYPALGEHLKKRLPGLNANPGQIPSYSNYGYALAGYAVERAAGTPFRNFVGRRLFDPLGMSHSFYAVPPMGPELNTLAREYTSGGDLQPVTYSQPYPAGGAATTAGDMGRFLQAFLAAHSGNAGSAISPETAQAMTTVQLAPVTGVGGEGFGLNQQWIAGRLVWMKGGAAPKHSAVLVLLPQRNAGVFIALNRQEPLFWEGFLPKFLAAFYPADPAPQAVTPPAPTPEQAAGTYEFTRISTHSIEKFAKLLFQLRVTASGPETVTVSVMGGDLPQGAFTRAGGVYRNGDHYLAFRMKGGKPAVAFANVSGEHMAFRRIAWWEAFEVQAIAVAAALLLTLSFPLFRLISGAWNRLRRRQGSPTFRQYARAGHAEAAAAAVLLVSAAWTVVTAKALLFGPTLALYALSGASLLFAAVSVWTVGASVMALPKTSAPIMARLHLLAAAVGGALLSSMLFWYNAPLCRF